MKRAIMFIAAFVVAALITVAAQAQVSGDRVVRECSVSRVNTLIQPQ